MRGTLPLPSSRCMRSSISHPRRCSLIIRPFSSTTPVAAQLCHMIAWLHDLLDLVGGVLGLWS